MKLSIKIIFAILKMKGNIYSNFKEKFFIKALIIYSKLNYKLSIQETRIMYPSSYSLCLAYHYSNKANKL